MNKFVFAMVLFVSTNAFANADLVKTKNCMACHAVDKKLVGPSFKDIASKYKSSDVPLLALKVKKGGSGVWGAIPMPANPNVNDAEAKALVEWILKQK
jgi:cytochrome c